MGHPLEVIENEKRVRGINCIFTRNNFLVRANFRFYSIYYNLLRKKELKNPDFSENVNSNKDAPINETPTGLACLALVSNTTQQQPNFS